MDVKYELIERLKCAVKCKCYKTARARIRDIAEYCKQHDGIDVEITIKKYTQKYLEKK